jgi:hypothetical protein
MPVLEFVGLWQERLAAVQSVGCSYADSTLAFKLLGEKFLQMQIAGAGAGSIIQWYGSAGSGSVSKRHGSEALFKTVFRILTHMDRH